VGYSTDSSDTLSAAQRHDSAKNPHQKGVAVQAFLTECAEAPGCFNVALKVLFGNCLDEERMRSEVCANRRHMA